MGYSTCSWTNVFFLIVSHNVSAPSLHSIQALKCLLGQSLFLPYRPLSIPLVPAAEITIYSAYKLNSNIHDHSLLSADYRISSHICHLLVCHWFTYNYLFCFNCTDPLHLRHTSLMYLSIECMNWLTVLLRSDPILLSAKIFHLAAPSRFTAVRFFFSRDSALPTSQLLTHSTLLSSPSLASGLDHLSQITNELQVLACFKSSYSWVLYQRLKHSNYERFIASILLLDFQNTSHQVVKPFKLARCSSSRT